MKANLEKEKNWSFGRVNQTVVCRSLSRQCIDAVTEAFFPRYGKPMALLILPHRKSPP